MYVQNESKRSINDKYFFIKKVLIGAMLALFCACAALAVNIFSSPMVQKAYGAQENQVSQASINPGNTDIVYMGYSPSDLSLYNWFVSNNLMDSGKQDDYSSDVVGDFWLVNAQDTTNNNCYCILLITDYGMYFVADNENTGENYNIWYYQLNPEKETVYYNPTTLSQYVSALEDNQLYQQIWAKWQKVNNFSQQNIPTPNWSGASTTSPINVVYNLWIYDGSVYPASMTPSLNPYDNLYQTNIWSNYSITSNTDTIANKMIMGSMAGANLTTPGSASAWLSVPNYGWIKVCTTDQNSAGYTGNHFGNWWSQNYAWMTPVNSDMSFASYSNNGYQATNINITTFSYNNVLVKDKYVTPYGTYFYYNTPDNDYTITISGMQPNTENPTGQVFEDVAPGTWYYNDVNKAAQLGYIHGYTKNAFGPNDLITRGQIATVLFNMADQNATTYQGNANFPDVHSDEYFYKPVAWAQINKVITGYSLPTGTFFGPWDNTTREQLMTMIYRYAQLAQGGSFTALNESQINEELAKYPDGNKVSSWARAAVAWCVKNQVVSGSVAANGTAWLLPQNNITRAETATIAVRFQPSARTTPLGY